MKPLKLFAFHLLYLGLGLTFLSAVTLADDNVKIRVAQTQPSQGNSGIQYADDHLTVNVEDIALARLLQDIAQQSGFTVFYNGSLDETITVQFNQLLLEEGLHKILQQHNFAIEYVKQTQSEDQSSALQPVKLWIFYKGDKSGPYNTLQTALSEETPGEQEETETLDDYEYDPDTIVREYKAKTVAKALLKDEDSGIMKLMSASKGEKMSGAKVKELIENALKDVDEEIKGDLLKELDDIVEKVDKKSQ